MPSPAEVWVTPLSCSVCERDHDPDNDSRDCDHWCHDAGAEDWDGDDGE